MPDDQFALPFTEKLIETPGSLRLILETSFLPDWGSRYIPRELSTIMIIVVAICVATWFFAGRRISRIETGRTYSSLQWMALTAIALLLLGILQYAWFRDYAGQIGGRYLLNGLPWLSTLIGASWKLYDLRSLDAQDSREARSNYVINTVSVALLILFVLVAVGWWLVAWTQYDALINSVSATSSETLAPRV